VSRLISTIPPRILDAINLASPLSVVEGQIYAWASGSGTSVYTFEQLKRLRDIARGADFDDATQNFAADLYLALGTITALQRRPADGWMGYVRQWELDRLSVRVSKNDKTDFSRLRELEIRLGGILLNDASCPLVLLLPQPTGTWIQAGWECLIEIAGSPLGPNRNSLPILRQHVVPFDIVTHASPRESTPVPA
jgi:hypothetical protein